MKLARHQVFEYLLKATKFEFDKELPQEEMQKLTKQLVEYVCDNSYYYAKEDRQAAMIECLQRMSNSSKSFLDQALTLDLDGLEWQVEIAVYNRCIEIIKQLGADIKYYD